MPDTEKLGNELLGDVRTSFWTITQGLTHNREDIEKREKEQTR
jgi:hypothetical protein